MKAFLADPTKTNDEYREMIAYYYDLAGKLSIEIEKIAFVGLFEITLGDFVDTIVEAVNSFKNSLINRLVTEYQAKSKS